MNLNETMKLTTSLHTSGVWPDQVFTVEGSHETPPNLFYYLQLLDKPELFTLFYSYVAVLGKTFKELLANPVFKNLIASMGACFRFITDSFFHNIR